MSQVKCSWTDEQLSIKDFVCTKIEAEDVDYGQLERVSSRINNLTQAFGRLIETLEEKNKLGLSDVSYIAAGHDVGLEKLA